MLGRIRNDRHRIADKAAVLRAGFCAGCDASSCKVSSIGYAGSALLVHRAHTITPARTLRVMGGAVCWQDVMSAGLDLASWLQQSA